MVTTFPRSRFLSLVLSACALVAVALGAAIVQFGRRVVSAAVSLFEQLGLRLVTPMVVPRVVRAVVSFATLGGKGGAFGAGAGPRMHRVQA